MVTSKDIKNTIKQLPHSEGRVPYTYHHDYMRQNLFHGSSRSDIPNKNLSNDEELYAVALVQIVSELDTIQLIHILDNSYWKDAIIEAIVEAEHITKRHIDHIKATEQI